MPFLIVKKHLRLQERRSVSDTSQPGKKEQRTDDNQGSAAGSASETLQAQLLNLHPDLQQVPELLKLRPQCQEQRH